MFHAVKKQKVLNRRRGGEQTQQYTRINQIKVSSQKKHAHLQSYKTELDECLLISTTNKRTSNMSRSHTASIDRLIPPLRSLDAPRSMKRSSGSGTGALEKQKRGVNGDGADRRTSGYAAGYGPPRVAAIPEAHVHLRAAAQHS